MIHLLFTARSKNASESYSPLDDHNLHTEVKLISGKGSAQNPWRYEVKVTAEQKFEGVIRMALPIQNADPRYYLPGFMYGTNRGEAPLVVDSKCPRLRENMEFPASPWWMVRSDRLSHPCAFVYGSGKLTGFAASPYYVKNNEKRIAWKPGITGEFDQYTGFGCSIQPKELIYTLGYENAPWFFLEARKYFPVKELDENCFVLSAGESVTVHLYCFEILGEDERILHDALKWVYGTFHEAPAEKRTVQQTVMDIASAIAEDAWLPEHHTYSGFVFDRGAHLEYNPLPSISWTNGLSASVPMLLSAYRLNNEKMRAQALDNIEHIVKYSLNPKNGLPYMVEQDGVWSNNGWWYDRIRTPGHAAYLIGQSMYLILKAYVYEKKERNTEHADWLEFVSHVIARTEQTRNTDGEYPYVMSEKTGAGLEYDSFSGSWCMAAAAYYTYITGEKQYLDQLLQSETWYHDAYIRHQECYGGPLDIDKGIDSEGILAYIRAVHYLHELTGKEELLEHMKDALYYEFTFKFCYNSPIKVPPLSTVGWSSCGGSITSVTNPHIHPMSSSVVDEMYYYLSQTEDTYIRSRLEDTILWSCQCHNTFDREFGYGKKGWMSERFCHSEGLVKEKYPDGTLASTWFALMPWACGSLLEGLAGNAWERKSE